MIELIMFGFLIMSAAFSIAWPSFEIGLLPTAVMDIGEQAQLPGTVTRYEIRAIYLCSGNDPAAMDFVFRHRKERPSYRVVSHCMAMGEAAGTAAALSVASSCTPRELDSKKLRLELADNGANTGF